MTDQERELEYLRTRLTELKETQHILFRREQTFTTILKLKKVNKMLANTYHRINKIHNSV